MENFDELEKAMNVKTEIVKETKSVKVKPVKNEGDDPQKDYEYSRAQLYNLVEKGQEAINGILDVCQDSQHPRACLLYTSPSPRDRPLSRMPSSA